MAWIMTPFMLPPLKREYNSSGKMKRRRSKIGGQEEWIKIWNSFYERNEEGKSTKQDIKGRNI